MITPNLETNHERTLYVRHVFRKLYLVFEMRLFHPPQGKGVASASLESFALIWGVTGQSLGRRVEQRFG
jgi:hypothetical protein